MQNGIAQSLFGTGIPHHLHRSKPTRFSGVTNRPRGWVQQLASSYCKVGFVEKVWGLSGVPVLQLMNQSPVRILKVLIRQRHNIRESSSNTAHRYLATRWQALRRLELSGAAATSADTCLFHPRPCTAPKIKP